MLKNIKQCSISNLFINLANIMNKNELLKNVTRGKINFGLASCFERFIQFGTVY